MKPLMVPGSPVPHGGRASRAESPSPGSLDALLLRWHTEEAVLRHRGARAAADALASCVEELAQALRQLALEELTPVQAAAETGYSASAIRRRFPGRKTIPRGDLPLKGGRAAGGPDLAAELLAREAGRA